MASYSPRAQSVHYNSQTQQQQHSYYPPPPPPPPPPPQADNGSRNFQNPQHNMIGLPTIVTDSYHSPYLSSSNQVNLLI